MGSVTSWKIAGTTVTASRTGHASLVPRIDSSPRICDTKMEMVMTSWYTVPTCNTDHGSVKVVLHFKFTLHYTYFLVQTVRKYLLVHGVYPQLCTYVHLAIH
jgi:hypothetical protein